MDFCSVYKSTVTWYNSITVIGNRTNGVREGRGDQGKTVGERTGPNGSGLTENGCVDILPIEI